MKLIGLRAVALIAGSVAASQATAQFVTGSDHLPPIGGVYLEPNNDPLVGYLGNQLLVRHVQFDTFSASFAPPASGSNTGAFQAHVSGEYSTNGGGTFIPLNTTGNFNELVTFNHLSGPTRFFDTEMLQMDLVGGSLPDGVMIRESPTLASHGQTSITTNGGNFQISSFFDIFTELSIDGGQTWNPGSGPAHVDLQPEPATLLAMGLGVAVLIRSRRRRR